MTTDAEHCPNCGVVRETAKDRFCRKCGQAWETTGAAESARTASTPAASAAPARKSASPARQLGIGCGVVIVLIIVVGVIAAIAGSGSSSNKSSTTTGQSAGPTTGQTYTLAVTQLQCSTDAIGGRTCTGTVKNMQADKNVTDVSPVVHWTGGTDSDFGSVDINPLLPGQESSFTVTTLHPNPQLTHYTIGFKKVFGKESDYPVDPVPLR